ncbi:polygalacturonase QRT3-like [Olea europaea var. sylvestris]|uniref:polygalacturonase QRT3-like n=1 Tax=Olea europaea var. sylvestris TaxID=158386 RepID=UPI000C1CD785|nr:polygalacturonase QRT3-like [Olea europaea var. sylvestris]
MTVTRKPLSLFMVITFLATFATIHVHGQNSSPERDPLQFRDSLVQRNSELYNSSPGKPRPLVYDMTSYGADPTGVSDSTNALLKAISDALKGPSNGFLSKGIVNLGGAQINLQGGNYLISRPLQFPVAGRGNLLIHGGTLKASSNFPADGYLIDISPSSNIGSSSAFNYEFITLRDLLLDSNYRGGGIQVLNSLRISIDNCYITHFTTNGIIVRGGHETYIRSSYLGQHITAGGDRDEKSFSGTGINLMGNDNSVTDVVIFSAATGIMVSGQANTLSGVHCYNKATGFGGTGIYLKLPGLTQTRIVNSYLDFTGIVAEDPVQLHISSSFFLGDAYILLKSINGVMNGVNIVDNMFAGSNKGIDIVQLDQQKGAFKEVDQVIIDRNNVRGMKLKATVARQSVQGNGKSWIADLNSVLLFPNRIKRVQYTFITTGNSFPNHALRNLSSNKVVIQSNLAVPATIFITADQGNSL